MADGGSGSTPLSLAVEHGHTEVAAVLEPITTAEGHHRGHTRSGPPPFVSVEGTAQGTARLEGNYKFLRGELGLGYYLQVGLFMLSIQG